MAFHCGLLRLDKHRAPIAPLRAGAACPAVGGLLRPVGSLGWQYRSGAFVPLPARRRRPKRFRMNTRPFAPLQILDRATAGEIRDRPGRASDAEVCGAICYEGFRDVAERHNFPPDMSAELAQGLVDMLFTRSDVQSFVAE